MKHGYSRQAQVNDSKLVTLLLSCRGFAVVASTLIFTVHFNSRTKAYLISGVNAIHAALLCRVSINVSIYCYANFPELNVNPDCT